MLYTCGVHVLAQVCFFASLNIHHAKSHEGHEGSIAGRSRGGASGGCQRPTLASHEGHEGYEEGLSRTSASNEGHEGYEGSVVIISSETFPRY